MRRDHGAGLADPRRCRGAALTLDAARPAGPSRWPPSFPSRFWSAVAGRWTSVEQTRLGAFAFGKFLPAYFFCLVLAAKVRSLHATLVDPSSATLELGAGHLAVWLVHQSLSIVFLGLVVVLFVVRKPVVGPRTGLRGALVALAGTFALGLLAGHPVGIQPWPIFLAASGLILFGVVFTMVSLVTLGTCFGVFPEARGLVTRGPYARVRHPVYLGEMVSGFGLVLPILSPYSLAVFLLFVGLQYWRALNEERALEATFPEYANYRARTWRLVPWVH